MSELPEFMKRPKAQVVPFLLGVLGAGFVEVKEFEDHHFRVVFKASVFTMQEGQSEPTNSQWSTLKKRMKRRDRRLFIFKQHGQVPCPPDKGEGPSYYLDFGYFAH